MVAGALTREERRRCPPPHLSEREEEVLRLIAQGVGDHDIAARLVISEETVKTHVEHIFIKLGVRKRTAAVAAWITLSRGDPGPENPRKGG